MSTDSEPLYTSTGQLAGKLTGHIFRKVVTKSRHLMLKNGGMWGIDYEAFKRVREHYDGLIKILERESMMIYSISAAKAEQEGTVEEHGHGKQIFIPLDAFDAISRKELLKHNRSLLKWFAEYPCQCANCLAGNDLHRRYL